MTNKRRALWGNILTTLAFFVGNYAMISFNLATSMDDSVVSLTISIFDSLLLSIILHIMTWIAYVMIGKVRDKGWKIFLLVVGILLIVGAVFGMLFATVTLVVINVNGDEFQSLAIAKLLGELLQLAGGIFFILAFAMKQKNTTISNG